MFFSKLVFLMSSPLPSTRDFLPIRRGLKTWRTPRCCLTCVWVTPTSWWSCWPITGSYLTSSRSVPLPNRSSPITFKFVSSKSSIFLLCGQQIKQFVFNLARTLNSLGFDLGNFQSLEIWYFYDINCKHFLAVLCCLLHQMVLLRDASRWSGWREAAGSPETADRVAGARTGGGSAQHCATDVLSRRSGGGQTQNVHRTLQTSKSHLLIHVIYKKQWLSACLLCYRDGVIKVI